MHLRIKNKQVCFIFLSAFIIFVPIELQQKSSLKSIGTMYMSNVVIINNVNLRLLSIPLIFCHSYRLKH